jgi:hypothetical protein
LLFVQNNETKITWAEGRNKDRRKKKKSEEGGQETEILSRTTYLLDIPLTVLSSGLSCNFFPLG